MDTYATTVTGWIFDEADGVYPAPGENLDQGIMDWDAFKDY